MLSKSHGAMPNLSIASLLLLSIFIIFFTIILNVIYFFLWHPVTQLSPGLTSIYKQDTFGNLALMEILWSQLFCDTLDKTSLWPQGPSKCGPLPNIIQHYDPHTLKQNKCFIHSHKPDYLSRPRPFSLIKFSNEINVMSCKWDNNFDDD